MISGLAPLDFSQTGAVARDAAVAFGGARFHAGNALLQAGDPLFGPVIGDPPADNFRVTSGDKNERIYLRADKAVSYGDLMEVMNLLRNAGYLKIALVGLDGRS